MGRRSTYIAVYSVDDVLGWEMGNLRIDLHEEVGELFYERLPLAFGEAIYWFCISRAERRHLARYSVNHTMEFEPTKHLST